MQALLLSIVALTFLKGVDSAHSAVKGTGSTTRGWSCCKQSCSWSNKAPVDNPVISCDAQDNLLNNAARRDGCDSGGGAFGCSDLSPWAASNELAYGFAGVNLAATNETAWCCSCYSLTFTSGPISGKKMIVQVTNTGSDLGNDQFDLAIPGGGQGDTKGCTKQFGSDVWGAPYGGVEHREDCDALPNSLKAGCFWRFDWFRNADNPTVQWEKVTCPEDLSYVSGCRRNDDPVPGQNTPIPTPTKSAPISSGTVVQGGQCGGKTYRGPTVCVPGTVCTFVDENSYYCLPDPASTRSTPTTTSPTATPTIALVWDQCGGRGYTGPTRCKDSNCVRVDEWYSQCQPISGVAPPTRPTTRPTPPPNGQPTNRPGRPTRRPTRPGNPPNNPPASPTSNKPPGPSPTIAQLYEQCGGQTFTGPTRCAAGLSCIYIDDYYSQCQKPESKSPKFRFM